MSYPQMYSSIYIVKDNKSKILLMTHQLSLLIEKCWDTTDIDSQFALLKEINTSLPAHDRIAMPSLVTDDYCRRALEIIEAKIAKTLKKSGREFNWP